MKLAAAASFCAPVLSLATLVVAGAGDSRDSLGARRAATAPGSAGIGQDGPGSFVNWENHPIHGLAITPDGNRLLLVNLPDARLEVFDLTGALPRLVASIPVGVDPVAVRARSNTEAWVANHISDSVSIVNLSTLNVVATLPTADEPFDIAFAGSPARAFVSCSQANQVQVFDPANLTAAPVVIPIDAEDPRALAVSPDGQTVYAAVWESGNGTTILGGGIDPAQGGTLAFPPNVVNNPGGPWGGANPPPNNGLSFSPPIAGGLPTPPRVGLVVRRNAAGQWLDDNGGNWTNLVSGPQAVLSGRPVGWDLPDRDVAIINASSLAVTYATALLTTNMDLAVNPSSGRVTVVGTESRNEVRFEPNAKGRFLRVHFASFDPSSPASSTLIRDLNPHLTYASTSIPQTERDKSLGDPRALAWNAAGTVGYVAGMGSNNVIVIDNAGNRTGVAPTIGVGEGPVALALDEGRSRLYVLNRFEGSLSVVSTTTQQEVARLAFHDATPGAIKAGRPLLYDTHRTSGLGQLACASCHIDGRTDRLAWDLGDPTGAMKALNGLNLGAGILGLAPPFANPAFTPFHPMKGPMTTQTLQGIIGLEPHHWRGDRLGLEEFNPAFEGLLGDTAALAPAEMQAFEDMLASITFPPNPNRNLDNSLSTSLPLPGQFTTGRFGPAGQPLPNGNAQAGLLLYRTGRLDGGVFDCVTCHTLPTGAGTDTAFAAGQFGPIPVGPMGEHHIAVVSVDGNTQRTFKTPQLRTIYEKVGFDATQTSNRAGFGLLHDGSVDSIARFVSEPAFNVVSNQQVADLVAFLLSFAGSDLPAGSPTNILEPPGPPSKDTHAAVGRQTTLVSLATAPPQQTQLIGTMVSLAQAGKVGLIAKGLIGNDQRGFVYRPGGTWDADMIGVTHTLASLQALAAPGAELTFTVVPKGTEMRLGIDRDEDGWRDHDENRICADPADPTRFPGSQSCPDANGDLALNVNDFIAFQTFFALGDPRGDFNRDGVRNINDFIAFQTAFALCN